MPEFIVPNDVLVEDVEVIEACVKRMGEDLHTVMNKACHTMDNNAMLDRWLEAQKLFDKNLQLINRALEGYQPN